MIRATLAVVVLVAFSGCTTQPSFTKQRMTLAQAGGVDGLECRRAAPVGSNMKQTVCASPEAWVKYDREREFENQLIFDTDQVKTGVGPFGRQ